MSTLDHAFGNYRYNKIKVLNDKSATVLVVGAGFIGVEQLGAFRLFWFAQSWFHFGRGDDEKKNESKIHSTENYLRHVGR